MSPKPPRLFLRFFRWFCHPKLVKYVEGDLLELYYEREKSMGRRKAGVLFAVDVLLLFRPSIIRPAEGYTQLNNFGMIKNYLKVAWRNVVKYKAFSFVNVFGLALAMSICMLVMLMFADQARYDSFHAKKDRIYRITTVPPNAKSPYATSPFPAGAFLKTYPVIEETVTLLPSVAGDVQFGQRVTEMKGYFTSPSFFRVFDFKLLEGSPEKALEAPRSIVLSDAFAQSLFPGENALGKVVSFSDRKLPFSVEGEGIGEDPVSWGEFIVTGVMSTNDRKSHLSFDVLMSESTLPLLYAEKKIDDLSNSWDWFFRAYNYVLIREGTELSDVERVLSETVEQHRANLQADHARGLTLVPQPLASVQMDITGNDTSIRLPLVAYYLLGTLAAIIMLSACVNYTSLSIARALTRSREIGIRKVTGARRRSLIIQFIGESVLISLLALVLAMIMLQVVKPAFLSLWVNRFINFELPFDWSILLRFTGFAILVGVVAGLFPALRMSRYQPIAALRGKDDSKGSRGTVRTLLSVAQFSLSLLFITSSLLVFKQFRHYINFDYGIRTENVLNLDLQGKDYQLVASELSSIPGVLGVSGSDLVPATGRTNATEIKRTGTADFTKAYVINSDHHFASVFGLELIAGSFPEARGDTTGNQIVVNEKFVSALGFVNATEAIGEMIDSKWESQPLTIVGVMKDFRFQLLVNRHETDPLMIFIRPGLAQYASILMASNDIGPVVTAVESTWARLDPLHPVRYEFFDDQLAGTHQAIRDIFSILGFIAFLAIAIACLGLLGIATYMAERRKKEVGIRKVMGAAEWGIALLLSRSFLKILGISISIGAPLSYFINSWWLEYLPNRVELGFGTILLSSSALLVLGLITVGSQTVRASRSNPVDSLKE